jgi:hypothetical protein
MADKVVTYTEPTTTALREVRMQFDTNGDFVSMQFELEVESDSSDPASQLGSRRMSGSAEAADMNPGQLNAVGVILSKAIDKFLDDEGF